MYTLPTKTKAFKAMKATVLAAQVAAEPAAAPAAEPVVNDSASESSSVPPSSISIEMTPDEYFAYRSAKESTNASQ